MRGRCPRPLDEWAPKGGFSVAALEQDGIGVWANDDAHRGSKQNGDSGALEVEGDPHGGLEDDEYRAAARRD